MSTGVSVLPLNEYTHMPWWHRCSSIAEQLCALRTCRDIQYV